MDAIMSTQSETLVRFFSSPEKSTTNHELVYLSKYASTLYEEMAKEAAEALAEEEPGVATTSREEHYNGQHPDPSSH
jgi:hypothetical protein